MLRKLSCVDEPFGTDGALLEGSGDRPHGVLASVNSHVSFQISLGGECSLTNFTLERTLSGMSTVVHLKGGFAGQDSATQETLVRVCGRCHFVSDELSDLLIFVGV